LKANKEDALMYSHRCKERF